MDDIVRQAMAKWPNVPDCFGWLGLDARGNWYMRDDRCQALGTFASGQPGAKGSMLQHAKLIDFIQRNYACDEQGRWFFQNGPQRVYVELEASPFVWRVAADAAITSHDGQPAEYRSSMVDEFGWFYLETSIGWGLVHTQDMTVVADLVESAQWMPSSVMRHDMAPRFGSVLSPQATHPKGIGERT